MDSSHQDFTRRFIIVVRKDVESWQAANAIGHIAAYLGNKMKETFDTGSHFVSKDNFTYPRNSQYPIIIKSANSTEQLHNLMLKVKNSGLLHIAFIRQMIDHTNDADLQNELTTKTSSEIEYLGVGIFGSDDEINLLTKKFSLFK